MEDSMQLDSLNFAKSCQTSLNTRGIVPQFGGKCFDITLESAEKPADLANTGFNYNDVQKLLRLLGKRSIHVSVFVSLEFPDNELVKLLSTYGELKYANLHHLHYPMAGYTVMCMNDQQMSANKAYMKLDSPVRYMARNKNVHFWKKEISGDMQRMFVLATAGKRKYGAIQEAKPKQAKKKVKRRRSLQHACQVKSLLQKLDPAGVDIGIIAEEDGCKVWLDWVMPNLAKPAGGTLKSYLNSLHMFIQFVVNRRPRPGFPTLTPEVQEIFQEVLARLKAWRCTITKQKSSARYTRILAETERMLTTPKVNQIMASVPAQEGKKALVAAEKCTDTSQLTVSQYTAAWDFIIMAITRNCGTCPGALETVTLGQWRAARWDEEET
ncbi:hypothetical protein AWC38_SpisGene18411 [Stylophora pistillata]|uniref:Uncharacterized protein n=1 Tax=Stylophora pistillata TaxID=50429 RepID=A0A2B4RM00_STYPI|nr:hypothetical protein AWC38_SpisGene18411 [Stylophora pistillata]